MLAQAIHSSDNHPAAFPVSYGSYLFKPRTVRMQGYQDSVDEHASSWHSQATDVGQPHQYSQPSGDKPSSERFKIETPDHSNQYGTEFQGMGRLFSGRQPEYADPSKPPSRAAGQGHHLRLSTGGARYFPETTTSAAEFSDSDYASPTGGAIPHSGSSGMPIDAFGSRLGDLSTGAKVKAEDELDDDGLLEDDDTTTEQSAADQLASKRKMKRFRLTHQQTRYLMSEFAKQPHPDAALRNRLSSQIPGLSPRQVQVWFQNRRAKIKRLNVDDRERMLQMRTVPEGFDNVRALHSPYGALHGAQEPSPTSAARSYPHVAGFSQPPMMGQSHYGHDNTAIPASASRHFSNDVPGEKAHGVSSAADTNFSPDGMGTPSYTFSQYQESSAAHASSGATMHEAMSYYDPNQSSMGGEASWKSTAGGESTTPDHASAKEQTATGAQPDQAHLRARYDAAQHPLVSPHRGPVMQETSFQGNWGVHSPYMAQDPRDPFGFGFNAVPPSNPPAESKGTTAQYYPYSHGMPAVTEGMFPDSQMMYAHRGADMGTAGLANPGDASSARSGENGGYQSASSEHGRHQEGFPGSENVDKKSGQ